MKSSNSSSTKSYLTVVVYKEALLQAITAVRRKFTYFHQFASSQSTVYMLFCHSIQQNCLTYLSNYFNSLKHNVPYLLESITSFLVNSKASIFCKRKAATSMRIAQLTHFQNSNCQNDIEYSDTVASNLHQFHCSWLVFLQLV